MALPTPTAATAITGYIPASRRRYVWVTTMAAYNTPTSAEITAGTDVTSWVIPDGVSGFTTTSEIVEDPRMDTRVKPVVAGMITVEASSIRFRQSVSGTNDARGTFHRDDNGYMVVFPEGIIASGKCSVFPSLVTNASPENGSGDAIAAIMVGFASTNTPAESIAIPTA